MTGGDTRRLPDAADYDVWLLCVGAIEFEAGTVLPDRSATVCANALVLRGHGETLLVDAGSGPADVLWPGAGGLDEALGAAGVDAGDVDAVILTHLDFDHAGGVLAGEWPADVRPAFSRVIVSEVDLGVGRPGEPEDWDVGSRLLELYEQAGGLEIAVDGSEFRPGLRLVSAPGHRPGHCVLLVGDELVHGADLLHHEAHVEHPEWDGRFDADPALALETRKQWLGRLAQTATPVVFSHVPGRGRIASGPRWRPDDA
jgi:glyoxylase-like metal-dependent hydrolase (beta-lactamase superfamily II)